jgi:hypothetical protein
VQGWPAAQEREGRLDTMFGESDSID